MELYMNLETPSSSAGSGGLGFLNATEPELELSFEIVPPELESTPLAKGRNRRREKKGTMKSVTVDLTVVQDPSALKSRSGDTGGYSGTADQEDAAYHQSVRMSLT